MSSEIQETSKGKEARAWCSGKRPDSDAVIPGSIPGGGRGKGIVQELHGSPGNEREMLGSPPGKSSCDTDGGQHAEISPAFQSPQIRDGVQETAPSLEVSRL